MGRGVEVLGRLPRSDKRPANPGKYDLQFQLHATQTGKAHLWAETLCGVDVMPGGFYRVVLGQSAPLGPRLFNQTPRYLSVRVVRGNNVADEHGGRIPVMGDTVRLGARLAELETRMKSLQEQGASGPRIQGLERIPHRVNRMKDWLEGIQERVVRLEDDDAPSLLNHRVDQIRGRLELIEGDDGRLDHIEDEIEDLVGPDGDVVDLNERMDALEGRAPELITSLRRRMAGTPPDQVAALRKDLDELKDRFALVAEQLEHQAGGGSAVEVTPESIGALNRAGDAMLGGLTINRGGLEVLSGGIRCRGAEVNSLEASHLVKAPKSIFEALELRGDLTVDNTHRVIQCRSIEGRQGSARKDGPLHLNGRGGGEVVVGHTDAAKGMKIHGEVRATRASVDAPVLSHVFAAQGTLREGDVVSIDKHGVVRTECASDPAVAGVVVTQGSIQLGGVASGGHVAVGLSGVVRCKVDAAAGAIAPGDLLVSTQTPGHAAKATEPVPGTVIGKALEAHKKGRGVIRILLWKQ